MPGEEQDNARLLEENPDIRWLLHNQASLDRRLGRVEDSMVFRALRKIGRFYTRSFSRHLLGTSGYAAWRARGGGSLPAPSPATCPRFTLLLPNAASAERIARDVANYPNCEVLAASFAEGVERATGDYIALVGEHDRVYPAALPHFAAVAPADLIYSDEEVLDERAAPVRPLFKPDWSPVLLQSANYLGGLAALRRDLLKAHASLLDAVQSLSHIAVAHIPAVLYGSRERRFPEMRSPIPAASSARVSLIVCTRTAHLLAKCLAGIRARTAHPGFELIVVQHLGSSSSTEETAVERVIAEHSAKRIPYTAAFNFAAMNNLAAESATGAVLLFLNDDIDPLTPEWLARLARWLERPEIGAAGAKLTFPDGVLQHAGIAAYMIDGAWHPGRNTPHQTNWPWTRYTREVSAVTGACLAVRAADFRQLGGFDTGFPVNFNDVDLCFRLRREGLKIIVDTEAELRHEESRTRAGGVSYQERRRFFRKWAAELERPDPFFTPHLAQNNEDLSLR